MDSVEDAQLVRERRQISRSDAVDGTVGHQVGGLGGGQKTASAETGSPEGKQESPA